MFQSNALLEPYRVRQGVMASDESFGMSGSFRVPCGKVTLLAVSSDGRPEEGVDLGWEHVSVSLKDRCPTWEEMCHVKDLFWGAEETVIQFHPPRSVYINNHPHVLHLWKPTGAPVALPPSWMVGVKGMTEADVRRHHAAAKKGA